MVPPISNSACELLVEMTPGVCGGKARVAGTRIPVWAIERAVRAGCTTAELVEKYPVLTAACVQAASDYARAHAAEMDAQIAEHEGA